MRETTPVWSILLLCMRLTVVARPCFGVAKETPLDCVKSYTINGGLNKTIIGEDRSAIAATAGVASGLIAGVVSAGVVARKRREFTP